MYVKSRLNRMVGDPPGTNMLNYFTKTFTDKGKYTLRLKGAYGGAFHKKNRTQPDPEDPAKTTQLTDEQLLQHLLGKVWESLRGKGDQMKEVYTAIESVQDPKVVEKQRQEWREEQ
jgi:hypothetical protein